MFKLNLTSHFQTYFSIYFLLLMSKIGPFFYFLFLPIFKIYFTMISPCPNFCLIWLVEKTILWSIKKTTNQIGCVQIDLFSMIKWSNSPNVKRIGFWSNVLINHDLLYCLLRFNPSLQATLGTCIIIHGFFNWVF